jgi:Ser/Thr protein kinase RdoA (MazF antagonist)
MVDLPHVAEAAYLTKVLRSCSVLDGSAVCNVTAQSSRNTIVSRIIQLSLSYDGPAPRAPRSLILKVAHPDYTNTSWNAGRQEVAFYREIAPQTPARLVPSCFDGAWNEETNGWHLLLEDLTDTHQAPTMWPTPPSFETAKLIIETLARLHSTWWDDHRLGRSVGSFMDRSATDQLVSRFASHYEAFSDHLGDRLSEDRRIIFQRFIDRAASLAERLHLQRNLTIVHGDAHIWNFLVPRGEIDDRVRVFDFDGWRIGVGSGDLAYMIAMHLYPERRRAVERRLLDCYHETLKTHGVVNYGRQSLDDDYRWSVLWQISRPIWQWSAHIPPVVWWNNMERIFLAFDDLGCRELLG